MDILLHPGNQLAADLLSQVGEGTGILHLEGPPGVGKATLVRLHLEGMEVVHAWSLGQGDPEPGGVIDIEDLAGHREGQVGLLRAIEHGKVKVITSHGGLDLSGWIPSLARSIKQALHVPVTAPDVETRRQFLRALLVEAGIGEDHTSDADHLVHTFGDIKAVVGQMTLLSRAGRLDDFRSLLLEPGAQPAADQGQVGAARILLIDDDPINLKVLRKGLEQDGYEIHTASNGPEGLEKAASLDPDLVMTDLQMPDMLGTEVIKTLRERGGAMPILLMTAFGSSGLADVAAEAGATDFLAKPIMLDLIRPVLAANIRRYRREENPELDQVEEIAGSTDSWREAASYLVESNLVEILAAPTSLAWENRVVITTQYPANLEKRIHVPATYWWISTLDQTGSINPTDLETLYRIIKGFVQEAPGLVVLDGIAYLITYRGFANVFKLLFNLKELMAVNNSCLIVVGQRDSLDRREWSMLSMGFDSASLS